MLPITVQGTTVPVVEWNAARVVTLGMVDAVHRRPEGTARRNFNSHRARLAEGRHYFRSSADEIRTRFPGVIGERATEDVTLLTERGYLMLVKSFTDELAWQVQDELVESYFRRAPAAPAVPTSFAEALRLAADRAEEAERVQAVIAELQPRSDALALIADAQGSLNMMEAAKAFQMRPIDLRDALVRDEWIWRRHGGAHWLGHATKMKQGLLTHKVSTVTRGDGSEKIVEQVRLTAKGIAKLAVLFGKPAPGALPL